MTLTSNSGQISVCLLVRYPQTRDLCSSLIPPAQLLSGVPELPYPGREITPISGLSFQSCQVNLLTTELTDKDWTRSKHVRLDGLGQF